MPRIDLHLHSTYSDGSCSPTEVVSLAHKAQVSTLALTDHDTTDGISEAINSAKEFRIEVITGIEISSLYKGKEAHILGYHFDRSDNQLQQHLINLRNSRHERIPKIISKLNTFGISLSFESIKANAGPGSIGRPHIAQALVDNHHARDINEAFSLYLGEGACAYVARPLPDVAEAIRWIRDAGGLASLAHPSWVRKTIHELHEACSEMKTYGLEAIEVFYSSHSRKQTADYLKLANQLELAVTGGSDFHGTCKPDIEVGLGKGNLAIPENILVPLRTRAEKNRSSVNIL